MSKSKPNKNAQDGIESEAESASENLIPTVLNGIQSLTSRIRSSQITPESPPTSFIDSEGRTINIRSYCEDDFESVVEMYANFDSSQRTQAIPPASSAAIQSWVTDLLTGINVVAVCDGQVVGHVAFVSDGEGRHELAIFVHQEYQQAGIGSALIANGMGYAREHGVRSVWLLVAKRNRYQQRFYDRAGFTIVNTLCGSYRMAQTL